MKLDGLHGLLLVVAMAGAAAGAVWAGVTPGGVPDRLQVSSGLDGATSRAAVVQDARGRSIPVRAYRRIASLDPVADHLLLRLVAPDRLVAVTRYTRERHPEGYRFGGRPTLSSSADLEGLLSLRPDLVVVSRFADEAYMSRLREEGVVVAGLGEPTGVSATVRSIRTLAAILDVPERGRRLENVFVRELVGLEHGLKGRHRPLGMYLGVFGDSLFGGTEGSNHADVLRYGGIRDAAARHGHRRWPKYGPEEVLAIDPPVIVTGDGMTRAICDHAILRRLQACHTGRVVELPPERNVDSGLGLVEAAQALQTLVHGIRPQLPPRPEGGDEDGPLAAP